MKTYLISLDLAPVPAHLHSYVISDDPRIVERVCNRMVDEAEKMGVHVMLPIFCSTILGDGDALVRDELCKHIDGVAEVLAKVTDFHLSMWMLPKDDPWDAQLMALH